MLTKEQACPKCKALSLKSHCFEHDCGWLKCSKCTAILHIKRQRGYVIEQGRAVGFSY